MLVSLLLGCWMDSDLGSHVFIGIDYFEIKWYTINILAFLQD